MGNRMVTQRIFRALDDPIRRSIVRLLAVDRLPVTEIAGHFEVSRPAISRHLRVLRDAELVSETRSGRERLYRLEPEVLEEAARWLNDVAVGRGSLAADQVPSESTEAPLRTGTEPVTSPDWRQW